MVEQHDGDQRQQHDVVEPRVVVAGEETDGDFAWDLPPMGARSILGRARAMLESGIHAIR
jgi:hypothetical protein